MAASASTRTSPGENPVGGTNADTGCTSAKSGGSVERVVPANANSAIESGTDSVVPSTTGGSAVDAADGGEMAGGGGTAAVTVDGVCARAVPGRRGVDRGDGGGVCAGAVTGGCVGGGGGGWVVGGGGCVVGVVSGTLVVVSGTDVVVASGSAGEVAASAVPAHTSSPSAQSVRPVAVTTPRGRALRGDVVRNMALVDPAGVVDRAARVRSTRTICAPLTALCVDTYDNARLGDRP